MKLQKKIIWTAIFATATAGLTGCFNSSSSGGTSSTAISGVVADGYLGNATVCLDINKNKVCDAGEPQSFSASGTGAYSLNATAEQIANAPILVEVTTSTTDSDLPNNGTVSKAYTLSAPAGKHAFVSPITTLIQAQLELDPVLTPEQAQEIVKRDLGIVAGSEVDLYKDFIAAENEDGYKALRQTGQIVARTLARFEEELNAKLTELAVSDATQKEIHRLVAEQVKGLLSTIYSDAIVILSSNGGEVHAAGADTSAGNLSITGITGLTNKSLTDKRREFTLKDNAEITTLQAAIGDGISFFQYKYNGELFGKPLIKLDINVMTKEGATTTLNSLKKDSGSDWLGQMSTDQSVKDDVSGDNKDYYDNMPITFEGNKGSFTETNRAEYVEFYNLSKVSLAGVTNDLTDFADDDVKDSTRVAGKTVTFVEGDIRYQLSAVITALIHKGNIASKTLVEVCGSSFERCARSTGQSDFSGIYDGSVSSSLNTKEGVIKGTFSDGKKYILDPRERDGVVNKYNVLISSGASNEILQKEHSIYKDGSPQHNETYPFYNLSATKRIHAAVIAP